MEAGWSARRVARQLDRSDHVVKKCWVQWIRKMSFTRRPGSGCPRQTSRRKTATSRDYNRVRVWRPCVERLNPAFAFQRHTSHAAGAIFQQDSARPHTARVSQDYLRTVTNLPWPAQSPDLSPIEYILEHLGWRVEHPTSFNELELVHFLLLIRISGSHVPTTCPQKLFHTPLRVIITVKTAVKKVYFLHNSYEQRHQAPKEDVSDHGLLCKSESL
ncbi:transposable element Tcb1 transposase [Trichonephila clavipes]|nr:transposable element Tcb1 transposase [Trichonephila clavipes]